MIELDLPETKNEQENYGILKHLFIVRHGNCKDADLNESGKEQMKIIAGKIREIAGSSEIYLMSSDVGRAIQSSKVIADELSLSQEFEKNDNLFDAANEKVLKLIDERRGRAPVLITLGHLDFVNSFPEMFYRKEFGEGVGIREISRGEAVHIDLEKRVYQIFPR